MFGKQQNTDDVKFWEEIYKIVVAIAPYDQPETLCRRADAIARQAVADRRKLIEANSRKSNLDTPPRRV